MPFNHSLSVAICPFQTGVTQNFPFVCGISPHVIALMSSFCYALAQCKRMRQKEGEFVWGCELNRVP